MIEKESIKLLQDIDCNCNDCFFMTRDFEKYKSFDNQYKDKNGHITNPSHRLHYGKCSKFNKEVSFIPNTCQIETQECFKHRKNI